MYKDVVFLYRTKAADDRDCCAYINLNDLRNNAAIDGHFNVFGACYSTRLGGRYCAYPYEDIDTILTEEQYNRLFNPKSDDDYTDIIEVLTSTKAADFYAAIIASEQVYLMEEYGLSVEEIEEIYDEYSLSYQDRAVVGEVYESAKDVGYAEMENYFAEYKMPDRLMDYFDYEKFGEDLVYESESYLELSSGMIVYLNY